MSIRALKRRYWGFVGVPNIQGKPYNSLSHRRAFQVKYW